MNFPDCSKSRFDRPAGKFTRFGAICAKHRRIRCIRRRVMSISFRDLNIGPNVVYENENGKINNKMTYNESNKIKYNNKNDK